MKKFKNTKRDCLFDKQFIWQILKNRIIVVYILNFNTINFLTHSKLVDLRYNCYKFISFLTPSTFLFIYEFETRDFNLFKQSDQ